MKVQTGWCDPDDGSFCNMSAKATAMSHFEKHTVPVFVDAGVEPEIDLRRKVLSQILENQCAFLLVLRQAFTDKEDNLLKMRKNTVALLERLRRDGQDDADKS